VAAIEPKEWSESDQKAIREQLVRILNSGPFHQAQRRQRFLEYIVNEALAGRGERLKGYNIAQAVFDRAETFDSNIDPIVRLEAGRLRDRLREYYDGDGQGDPIRISLPKGTYTPHIVFRRTPTLDPRPDRAANTKQLGILAGAVLFLIAAAVWGLQYWTSGPSLPDKPSVAVLPFDNIGADPKWERLADGMTDDVITDLSHSKDLVVIARNSTELYKDKPIDLRHVGRDLNVKYVLQGSIQSMGDQIRVNAQLIDVASGGHVWSERYDRPVDDLFVVQNDVTQRIAATLTGYTRGGVVAQAERRVPKRKPPASLSAFETYLLGVEAQNKVTKEGLIEAEGLFRKALQLDPQLARAYVGLADVQCYLIDLGFAPSVEEALSKMMEAGKKAVQLDPDDGATHYALGLAYNFHGKLEQALAEFDRAEALSPSDADLLLNIAWATSYFHEPARAVSLAQRSLALNPHYPDWYNQGLGVLHFFAEQYDKSSRYLLLVKEPVAVDYAFLAMAYAYLGRTGEAEAAANNVKNLDPTWIAERNLFGAAERQAELFVDGARKAGLPACVPADKLKDMDALDLSRVKSCDEERSREAAG
jgi:TolB-like protein/tetratricopeptide (TPR) repeat protein